MDWDPAHGAASPIFLRNHPSATAERAFVTSAIAEGVAARTMRVCARTALICILPLGVAFNSAGKRRLIWDGRHVNKNLRRRKFKMETLQREGRALFERSHFGGTADISGAYHHLEMAEDAHPYLGFEWDGVFYCFEVLPFGLSSAPWLFTTVMSHSIRFIRYAGGDVIAFLDDCIFGGSDPHGTITAAQRMLAILRDFGWLIHPTKCIGTSTAVQTFIALGTLVDLVTHTYVVPPATVDRILSGLSALVTGPPRVGVRQLARIKGLVASTWVATGVATRVRTREMDRVISSRPSEAGLSRRARRAGWDSLVTLSADCLAELSWWLANLSRVNGSPIRSTPLSGRFDSVTECDASDTGFGSVTFTEGPGAASSTLVAALLALATGHLTRREVVRRARRGLEFMAAFPAHILGTSSTLRELFGADVVITTLAPLLRGGRHKVVMDNLGCVFIMGGVVPAFATGARQWGEFVSGGSPQPALQRLAVHILDTALEHGFQLTFEWVPRERNVRADYLSHASESRQHSYRLSPDWFAYLDGLWGPRTIDRFASAKDRQPLGAPHTGRFCSRYFHPDAEWTDALSIRWEGENNWLFPPTHLVGATIAHLRLTGAEGTLICPAAPWASWWNTIWSGPARGWAADIVGTTHLGPAQAALIISPADYRLFGRDGVLAVRFGRRA